MSDFPLPLPEPHNWVVNLTARCNFNCSYCIQKEVMTPDRSRRPWASYRELGGREWVEAFNSFPERPEHPLILTGGEPSIHKDFFFIASRLEGYRLDLTSNLAFDIDRLIREMKAAGKVFATSFHTYHPKFMKPEEFVRRAELLRDSGIIEAPVFSMVDLDRFPHFRDEEHQENQGIFFDLARQRGLRTQRNEFRGQHMGSPFDRRGKSSMDCTSAWVNFAPNGDIYNCQYHLEQGIDCFGNVTRIEECRKLPPMGGFFSCVDFGFCDPCHENSGHGAFRDSEGRIFRRDEEDVRVYLQWMSPESLKEVAQRFLAQGEAEEAAAACLVAVGKDGNDPSTWAELGLALWENGQKKKALAAVMHAIEGGHHEMEALVAAIQLGRETEMIDRIRRDLEKVIPRAKVEDIEKAAMMTFV